MGYDSEFFFTYSRGHLQGKMVRYQEQDTINDFFDDETDSRNYYYIGKRTVSDTVKCNMKEATDRLTIDTGGGNRETYYSGDKPIEHYGEYDQIMYCPNIILSPFTSVHSNSKYKHLIFVKTNGFEGTDLRSVITLTKGTMNIYFTEFELVNGDTDMTYFSVEKELHITMKFRRNKFLLVIDNYFYPDSKDSIFLFNKLKHNVIPNFQIPEGKTRGDIKSFELNIVCPNESKNNLLKNQYDKCTDIDSTSKELKILTTVQFQNEENVIIGSDFSDVIIFHQNTIYAKGREDRDIYVMNDHTRVKEVIVHNYALDNILDIVIMPEIPMTFVKRNKSIFIQSNATTIEIRDFLDSIHNQHLIFSNSEELFIPVESTGRFAPFIQATATRNEFVLQSTFQYSEIVIEALISNTEIYRDGKDWLILSIDPKNPLKIVIPDYHANWEKWNKVVWFLYNNGTIKKYNNFIFKYMDVLDYKEKQKHDYREIVEEYVRDFSVSNVIEHNHLNYRKKRIGFLIIDKVSPKNIKLSKKGHDLILTDKKSKNSITIKAWSQKGLYRITHIEFTEPLESITIRGLDRFDLQQVHTMQSLIDRAGKNFDIQNKYVPLTSIGVKCIVAKRNFTYACTGFTFINEQIQFTKKYCGNDTLQLFKEHSSIDQIKAFIEKMQNDVILHGYNQTISQECEPIYDSIFTSEYLPTVQSQ